MIDIQTINSDISIGILNLKAFSEKFNISLKREQERGGAKFLLQSLLSTADFELNYTLHNKPFLVNRTDHISISHSYDKLVIILNKKENTGIDIELVKDTVIKIQQKFLNDNERLLANNNVEKLISYWAAKEVLYKIYGLKNLDFKKNLFIDDVDASTFFGTIEFDDYRKKYTLKKEKIENYILVYAINEI